MTTPAGPTPLETCLGSTQIPIRYLNGQEESITLRQLPMRLAGQFARSLEDPAAIIALCASRKLEWTDALEPDSFERLVTECDRLNRDFFLRWTSMQRTRLAGLNEAAEAAGLKPAGATF